MKHYTKAEALEAIASMMEANASNSTKASTLERFARLVKATDLDTYTNIKHNKNGANLGDLAERIVLRYLGLDAETEDAEVKSLILNSPNILTNSEVRTVYLLDLHANHSGLYRLDAKAVLNRKIDRRLVRELESAKALEKVASLRAVAKAEG